MKPRPTLGPLEPDRARLRGRRPFGRLGSLGLLLGIALLTGCAIPQWPVDGTMSSPFGLRFRGILPSVHHGVDIRAPNGTPVRSALPGTVRFAGTMSGYGRVIWVDHSRGAMTVYAHLESIEVRASDRVGGGEVIGHSGASGDATGPHLHFEVWKGGRPVDPVAFLGTRR